MEEATDKAAVSIVCGGLSRGTGWELPAMRPPLSRFDPPDWYGAIFGSPSPSEEYARKLRLVPPKALQRLPALEGLIQRLTLHGAGPSL